MDSAEVYEAVGGSDYFRELVEAFYVGIVADPVLRAMYPEDLSDSKTHLANFLIQYFGGPPTYLETRGHPRMRMRHAPFQIDKAAIESWLASMRAALVSSKAPYEAIEEMDAYFSFAAKALQNS
ncbi:MAG: globin [Actinomycetota bacterium]